MSFSATGWLALLGDAVPVLLYLAIVGLAVRVVFDRDRRLPNGFAVTAGFGLAVSMVCISAGFVLLRRLDLVVVALVLASALTVLGSLMAAPERGERAAALRRSLTSSADVGAVMAAVAVLAPVSGYANRLFTNGTNDFPSYSASVQVWRGAVGDGPDFTTVHPDAWGGHIEQRGLTEKPMVTAFMVLINKLTGRYPEQQEAVVFLLLVLIGTGALIALVAGVFDLRQPLATLLVLPVTMSSVPLSRLYDAQPGQVALVALLAVALVGAQALLAPGRGWLPALIPSSLALVALIGTNVTLALGLAPTVAALCAVIGLRDGGAYGTVLGRAVAWIALTLVLSLPFVPLYARSLELQVVGEAGFPVALAPPLGMLGLVAFDGYGDNAEAVAQWLLAIPVLFCGWRLLAKPTVRQSRIVVGAGLVVLANALAFVGWYGPGSYQTHKWLAATIVVLAPFVGAGLMRAWLDRTSLQDARSGLPAWVTVALTYCTIAATVLTYQVRVAPLKHVAQGVHALRENPTLAGVQVVNIALDDIYAAAIAVQAVPSHEVILTRANGATSAPIGDQFVVASGAGAYLDVQSQQPLNADVDLVTGKLTLPLGRSDLTTANPLTPRYLYGDWYDTQDSGVWARPDGLSGGSLLVFDVPTDASGEALALTLTLHRHLGGAPRPLAVTLGGRTAATGQFTTEEPLQVTVDIDPGDVRDGRVVVGIASPGPTADPGAAPPRDVGVGLSAVELARR